MSEERHFSSVDRGLTGFKARQNLAVLAGDMGDLAEAERQWREVVREVPCVSRGLARIGGNAACGEAGMPKWIGFRERVAKGPRTFARRACSSESQVRRSSRAGSPTPGRRSTEPLPNTRTTSRRCAAAASFCSSTGRPRRQSTPFRL